MKILFIEDDTRDAESFVRAVTRYYDEYKKEITYCIYETYDKGIENYNSSYDAAIIDLKLGAEKIGEETSGGKKIANKINEAMLKIPVIIHTGTPDSITQEGVIIDVIKKGEVEYVDIIKRLDEIYETGITKILGIRGKMESNLFNLFIEDILPNISTWIDYKNEEKNTEEALLRYCSNSIFSTLDKSSDTFFPEEVYVKNDTKDLSTGSLIKYYDHNYIVLSPACDLANRVGKKINYMQIAQICDFETIIGKVNTNVERAKDQKRNKKNLIRNNYSSNYHWLPETQKYCGGFIDYRTIQTISIEDDYVLENVQVSYAFLKDIIARFSSYYARQGQPNIDCEKYTS